MSNAIILLREHKTKSLEVRNESDNTGLLDMVYGVYNNEMVSGHAKIYVLTDDYERESLKNKVFKHINEGHTVFSNEFRAIIYGEQKDYYVGHVQMLRHITFDNDFADNYFFQLLYSELDRKEPIINHVQNSHKIKLGMQDVENITKYKLVNVPDNIKSLIKNNDVANLEKLLTLNTLTGFYEYDSIPIMCRHIFMYLKKISLIDISIECLKNGQCRYCGQEMTNYAEHLASDIPSSVVSVIYQFFDLIIARFDMNRLYYSTVEYLTKTLEKNNINSEKKQQFFTYLFFYNFLQHTSIKFQPTSKRYKTFISDCSKMANANGLTMNDLKNSEIVPDYKIFENILATTIYKNEINYFDIVPLAVLFNVDSFESRKELVPSTEYQKLFTMGKFKEFNAQVDMLIKATLKLSVQLFDESVPFIAETIREYHKSGQLAVFRKIIEYFCPVNIVHEYKGKACKHCGYNGSNDIDVYNKHSVNTNLLEHYYVNHFTTPDNTINTADIKENDLVKELSTSKFYNLLINRVGTDIDTDTKILEDIFGYKFDKLTKTDIKKLYVYYSKTHSPGDLENILLYNYNIGLVSSKFSLSTIPTNDFGYYVMVSDSDDED